MATPAIIGEVFALNDLVEPSMFMQPGHDRGFELWFAEPGGFHNVPFIG
jgi:hypothetical protein